MISNQSLNFKFLLKQDQKRYPYFPANICPNNVVFIYLIPFRFVGFHIN